ncbi:MAG: hypothetical protein Q9M10_02005, partial [Mariprofundaceae bacterium]|nr:hypothetical protein [Mariprofundaceae bacterium]
MKRTYPILTILSLLLLTALNACGHHKTPNLPTVVQKPVPSAPPISKPDLVAPSVVTDPLQPVTDLILKAQQPNQLAAALEGLQQLANH